MDKDLLSLCEQAFTDQIDAMIQDAIKRGELIRGCFFDAPVVGGFRSMETIHDAEKLEHEIGRALIARGWWAVHGMRSGPQLPVSMVEIMLLLRSEDPWERLVGHFAYSLKCTGWDFRIHPSWRHYFDGLLASPCCPRRLRRDFELQGVTSDRRLAGLDDSTLCWKPPLQSVPA
jgi:hypothetical protein